MPDSYGELLLDALEKCDGFRVKLLDTPAWLKILPGDGIDKAGGDTGAASRAFVGDVEGDALF